MPRRIIVHSDESVTVPANDTTDIGDDSNPIMQGSATDNQRDKARVRVALEFDGTPPSEADFQVRLDETVNGGELAIAIPDQAAVSPGAGNAVDAGVWAVTGPIPASVWLRLVNKDDVAHTISEATIYWTDA